MTVTDALLELIVGILLMQCFFFGIIIYHMRKISDELEQFVRETRQHRIVEWQRKENPY